jgi:hypothetical protein
MKDLEAFYNELSEKPLLGLFTHGASYIDKEQPIFNLVEPGKRNMVYIGLLPYMLNGLSPKGAEEAMQNAIYNGIRHKIPIIDIIVFKCNNWFPNLYTYT